MPRAFRAEIRQKLSRIGAKTISPRITSHLPTNRQTMPVKNQGNLGLVEACFHQGVNLMKLRWAEVFAGHGNFDRGVKKL